MQYDVTLVLQSKIYQSSGGLLSPENERESLYGDVIHVVRPENQRW